MTASIDWFVGSATKYIPRGEGAIADGRIQAFGFRGDDQLLALIVCDLVHVADLDLSSVNFHINLHPITNVQVILLSSGRTPAYDIRQQSPADRHHIVHVITDCVIDALTFGCPATMRITANAIQWRKFDEQPIATVVFHDQTHDPAHNSHAPLLAACGDPVMHVTHAQPQPLWDVTQLIEALAIATPQPLRHVSWLASPYGWQITLNDTRLVIDEGAGDYVVTSTPEQHRES